MKRLLVCGSNGLLGQRLAMLLYGKSDYEVLHTSHHRTFSLEVPHIDYTQLDISNKSDVKSLVSSYRPDVVLNAAAMTNVDECEIHRELAWKHNVTAVENLVEVCRRIDAKLVHISTDYVFDGQSGKYTEDDRAHPVNYYGKTKLAGENVIRSSGIDHAILRTVLLYGVGINVKSNFALWVIGNLSDKKEIRCVDDQISNPTHVHDLALAVKTAADEPLSGVFHISGSEIVSRYAFAVKAAEIFGFDPHLIRRVNSAEIPRPALRPMNTSFVIDKARQVFRYEPMNVTQGLTLFHQEQTGIVLN
ncbi:MAG: dTDP-4-dehydrorhamnose reductase [Bacteroidota bacterium]